MKLPYHRYELYEASVQDPPAEIEFFQRVFEEQLDQTPTSIREDFCATFRNSCQWVQTHPNNHAYAVDLDQETLDYGKAHMDHLTEDEKKRVHVFHDNVLTVDPPATDMITVSNFSIGYMKERKKLVQYLQRNYKHLRSPGLMVVDLLGGQEISVPQEEDRKVTMPDGKKVKYIWDHEDMNPITHEATFYIHYQMGKKPRMERVFEYHWRMWSIPEIKDAMMEAGFDDVVVYWEEDDENDEGSGYFSEHDDANDCPVWIAYVVGIKK